MICENCKEESAVSTRDGKRFVCTSCGAAWDKKGDESVWNPKAREALKKELRDELLQELKPAEKKEDTSAKVDWEEKGQAAS